MIHGVWYNGLMVNKGLILGGALVLFSSVFVSNTYAVSDTTDFNIKVNPSLSISVSSNAVGFQLTPTQEGNFGSASFNVYASTNNPTGYKIIMSTDKVDLESNTINPTTGTKPTIPTLTQGNISYEDFDASTDPNVLNHYGVAIKNGNYNAMQSTQEIEKTTVNNVTEDTITVSLASKLNLLTVPGVYSTTLNFQIVANIYTEGGSINESSAKYPANSLLRAFEIAYTGAGKPMYIEDANTDIGWRPMVGADFDTVGGKEVRFAMQDISMTFEENGVTHNVCEWATASAADNSYINEAPVMDLRDGKTYWIAKLADGKCWMTQNLDLNLVHMTNDEDALYTHENTDLGWGSDKNTVKWNPVNSTVNELGATFVSNDTQFTPRSFDPGDWYWIGNWINDGVSTWYESIANNYLNGDKGSNPIKFDTVPFVGNGEHGHVGNYYNWSAAIASNDSSSYYAISTYDDTTGNPQNSICPAGWRLPIVSRQSNNELGKNDFYDLVYAYGNVTSSDRVVTASPLWFVRGGYGEYFKPSGQSNYSTFAASGSSGEYWSSTSYPNAANGFKKYFEMTSRGVRVDIAHSQHFGISIRCILR